MRLKQANIASVFGLILLTMGLAAAPAAAATIHFSDFIPDGQRSNFNGFESLPASPSFGNTMTEDGIVVTQINGQLNDIWTNNLAIPGTEGARSWYPNGGDQGYTRITRAGGLDFPDVGMLIGSGSSLALPGEITVIYSLWDNGVLVQGGALPGFSRPMSYLGFGGGGFDEIRLESHWIQLTNSFNALALDSIELRGQAVPEPGTLILFGSGVAWIAVRRKARR